jgi:hypothetical protein
MAKPVSISAKAISAAARDSVGKALAGRKPGLPLNAVRIGYFPPHWIFGFILDPREFEKSTLAETQALASSVHGGIAGALTTVADAKPAFVVGGGHIICGFFPPAEAELLE